MSRFFEDWMAPAWIGLTGIIIAGTALWLMTNDDGPTRSSARSTVIEILKDGQQRPMPAR